ncbi:MAG: hypothetical protein ABI576_05985 [Flavobacterium sp.]
MKSALLKFIPCVLLTAFLNVSCSEHCDDEDYTRDEQEETAKKQQRDSLKVNPF